MNSVMPPQLGRRRANVVDELVLDEHVEVPAVAELLADGDGDFHHRAQVR
jgi:hypothetical protein